jgi:hypothetical protein
MKKSALIVVFAWLLWSRIENPPSETPSWMPVNTFGTEAACKEAAVKTADSVVNSQKDLSSRLALIRPQKQRNVILAYFNDRRVGTTIYSCAEFDPATPRLELPSNSTIPSYQ